MPHIGGSSSQFGRGALIGMEPAIFEFLGQSSTAESRRLGRALSLEPIFPGASRLNCATVPAQPGGSDVFKEAVLPAPRADAGGGLLWPLTRLLWRILAW